MRNPLRVCMCSVTVSGFNGTALCLNTLKQCVTAFYTVAFKSVLFYHLLQCKLRHLESASLALTLPSRFADRLDINMHSHALLCSLLTTVKGCHHNLVALLLVIAQALCVSDIT